MTNIGCYTGTSHNTKLFFVLDKYYIVFGWINSAGKFIFSNNLK